MKTVYLDHCATTPLHPDVLKAMLPFLRNSFGNPSSIHALGRNAREAVEDARGKVAALIGANASEIVFTSGGTEANNLAIQGIAHPAKIAADTSSPPPLSITPSSRPVSISKETVLLSPISLLIIMAL